MFHRKKTRGKKKPAERDPSCFTLRRSDIRKKESLQKFCTNNYDNKIEVILNNFKFL